MTALAWILILVGVCAGIWRGIRVRGPLVKRAIESLMPIAAAAFMLMLLVRIAQTATIEWNDAKLAPIVGITRGYELYQDPDEGVMTGWIYGPVGAMIMLPAALGDRPTTVGWIGSSIAASCFYLPVIWILVLAARGQALFLGMSAALVLGWHSLASEDLVRSALLAGPDAPALGLAACACALLYVRRTPLTMILSAVAAVLSIWTRHTMLPLPLALLAYIAFVDGIRRAGFYLAALVASGLVISGALIWTVGARDMYYHMIWLPMSHPLGRDEAGVLFVLGFGLFNLVVLSALAVALLLLVMLVESLYPSAGERRWRDWIIARPWTMPILVAIVLLPSSLVGFAKIGGYVNNLASTSYFLFLGTLAGLVTLFRSSRQEVPQALRSLAAPAVVLLGVVLAIDCMFGSAQGIITNWGSFARPYENKSEIAFEYARAHPGDVYAPWCPLITLLAEKKLYHFEWGMLDRIYASQPPSARQVVSHIPPRARVFLYTRQPQSMAVHNRLASHRRQVQVSELPGCIVYIE